MPQVETTAGPIDAEQLGRTLVHEHVLSASEEVRFQFPHLYDRDREFAKAVEQVSNAMGHGVKTIVDPAVAGISRDAAFAQRVAAETGAQLVLCTGIYGQHYRTIPHYFQGRDEDHMADVFVHDIEEGIQGTGVKAAFLKVAADEPGITPDVEKTHRAAARASRRTDRPIMAHSRPASRTGLEQMRIFLDEGVEPHKVQIAHTGDTDDLDYIEELLAMGPWIGMDRFGIEIYLPDDRRVATVVELCNRGHHERMMLSQDACGTIDWFPEEVVQQMLPDWTFTHLFEHILDRLREGGVTDEQIDIMLDENPKRWLTA